MNKEWLTEQLSVEECEAKHLVFDKSLGDKPIPFGFINNQWQNLLLKMQEGDEIWEFCSSSEFWQMLAGRSGVCLVRNGEIIDSIITAMN